MDSIDHSDCELLHAHDHCKLEIYKLKETIKKQEDIIIELQQHREAYEKTLFKMSKEIKDLKEGNRCGCQQEDHVPCCSFYIERVHS